MMNITKYLLAKYIPDLQRFEPRNIGVVVWSPFGTAARFLAEHPNRPGEVDGRSIPNFVRSSNAYKQWIRYWRDCVTRDSLCPVNGGASVPASSAAFPEVLQQTGRGNFVMVDAGSVLDDVGEEELTAVANQLFAQLVEPHAVEESSDLGFDELCDSLMARAQLKQHKNFHDRFSVRCTVRGVEEEFQFSHAIANGSLERAYQRFPIPKRKRLLQKNRDATAWMLESLLAGKVITTDNTVLLIDATPDQVSEDEVDKSIRLLGSMCHVVNLHDETAALQEFGAAARLPAH